MKNQIAQIYDKLSKTYEANEVEDNLYNIFYERPAMLREVPDDLTGMSVLDAGCSAGTNSGEFIKRGGNVTGIDISSKMIATAERTYGKDATFLCHDLQQPLPFADDTFDVVFSSLTMHYLEKWEQPFQDFHRVLKPGGMFLFSVHHPFMDFTLFQRDDYFKKELLHDSWKKRDMTIEVSFYRRPLQEIISTTSTYFQVQQLIEPQPVMELRDLNADSFEKLMKNPHFLVLKSTSKK